MNFEVNETLVKVTQKEVAMKQSQHASLDHKAQIGFWNNLSEYIYSIESSRKNIWIPFSRMLVNFTPTTR